MKKLTTLIGAALLIFNLTPIFKISQINTKFNNLNLKAANNPLAPKIINSKLTGITAIAVSKDGVLYVAATNGLNRSTDGIHFTQIQGIQDWVQDIFINESNGVIWVVTFNVNTGSNSKIYQSQDGLNFNESTNYFNDKTALSIIEFDGVVYVGAASGLYASTNGTNFTKIDQVQGMVSKFLLTYFPDHITTDKTLYTGGSQGLYELNDDKEFVQYPNIKDEISLLNVDKNGDIYFSKKNKLFKEVRAQVYLISEFPDFINSILSINTTTYVGTMSNGALYKSIDGKTFKQIIDVQKSSIDALIVDNKGVIFMGDYRNGLRAINMPYKLVNLHGANFDNNTFVFTDSKVIDINPEFLDSATLDGKNISVSSKGINLESGDHTLVLTLKNQYQGYADLFGGTKGNKVITYTLTS